MMTIEQISSLAREPVGTRPPPRLGRDGSSQQRHARAPPPRLRGTASGKALPAFSCCDYEMQRGHKGREKRLSCLLSVGLSLRGSTNKALQNLGSEGVMQNWCWVMGVVEGTLW